jgi:hypothetical protein
MKRICKYAHKIQEVFQARAPTPLDDVPPHITGEDARMAYAGWSRVVDIDDNDLSNWQCGWRVNDMPPPIIRSSGGNYLRDGDCESCRFFEPVAVTIPGSQPKPVSE